MFASLERGKDLNEIEFVVIVVLWKEDECNHFKNHFCLPFEKKTTKILQPQYWLQFRYQSVVKTLN